MLDAPPTFSVLLLDESGHHTQNVAICLAQKGVKLHVISNQAWVPVRFSRHIASFQSYDPEASEIQQLEAILHAIEQTGSEVFLPVLECGHRFAQTHRETLSRHIALPPCAPPEALACVINKDSFCLFLEKKNLPCPTTIYLDVAQPIEASLNKLQFPILFKPAHGGGGNGIRSFADRDSFLSFFKAKIIEPRSILQSSIQGHDIDCSVLCREGKVLAHTIQKSFLPRQKKYGKDDAIEFVENQRVLDVVKKLISALNWNGVAHIDLRYDEHDGQYKLLDFNPRYWTSLLGSLAANVNFPYLSCLMALDRKFSQPIAATGKFFTTEATVRQRIQTCFRNDAIRLQPHESGLRYTLSDPGPRIFFAAKKIFSTFKPGLAATGITAALER